MYIKLLTFLDRHVMVCRVRKIEYELEHNQISDWLEVQRYHLGLVSLFIDLTKMSILYVITRSYMSLHVNNPRRLKSVYSRTTLYQCLSNC